ncbi:MAG: hypothetical protein ACETWB_05390 [Anaerolineae bacterium]
MERRIKGLMVGGLIGAFLGVITAWFLLPKSLNDDVREGPAVNRIRLRDLVRLGLSILGMVRQIADLRRRS